MKARQYRLVLANHSLDEWVARRAEQARSLGCSNEYIKRLSVSLRRRAKIAPEVK